MPLKPVGPRVLVKPLPSEDRTPGGLIIPENQRQTNQKGTVIAVGQLPEGYTVNVGDIVHYPLHRGFAHKEETGQHFFIDIKELLAVETA